MTISKVADSKVERNKQMATALRYAKAGIPPFPVRNKQPLTPNGFKDATTDVAVIRLWWQRWPDADVAIPTGQASGRVILDLDNKTGAFEGRRSLEALEAEYGQLPDTPEVITPSKGSHLVFKAAPGIRNSAGKLGEGIDVRGDGGYVLVPGSKGYEWDSAHHPLDVQPADIPEWLLQKMQAAGRTGTPTRANEPDELEKIPKGKRNSTITSHLGRLRNLGYVREELHGFARVINDFRCDPPMPDEEVRKIVESVCSYERGRFEMGPDEDDEMARRREAARLQSATPRAIANKRARKLYPVAMRLAGALAAAKHTGTPATEDGLYHVPRGLLGGRDFETGEWEIAEATVKNHVAEIVQVKDHIPGLRAEKRRIPISVPWIDPDTGERTSVEQDLQTWVFDYDGKPADFIEALAAIPFEETRGGRRCQSCGGETKIKQVEYCPSCQKVEVIPLGQTLAQPPGSEISPIDRAAMADPPGSKFDPGPPSSDWDSIYERAERHTPKLESPATPNITPELRDLAGLIEVLLTGDYQLGRDVAQLAGDTGDPEADCEKAVEFLISQGRAHRYASGLVVATVDPLAPLSIPKHPENAQ